MRYFCTSFDAHFLVRGLALYDSLVRQSSQPCTLWFLCLDELSYQVLLQLNLKNVQLVTIADLERTQPDLVVAKSNRSALEFAWTCKSALAWYVLENHAQVDYLFYLGADLYFFNDPELLYNESALSSIAIFPHRFNEGMKKRAKRGLYNAGQVGFKRDVDGLRALRWWRDECVRWCYERVESERHADQKYLDYFPKRFNQVSELTHPGLGLAPWNWMNHNIHLKNNTVYVDTVPLVFYHFSNLRVLGHWIYDTGLSSWLPMSAHLQQLIYAPYVRALKANWQRAQTIDKHVQFGMRVGYRISPRIFFQSWRTGQLGWVK